GRSAADNIVLISSVSGGSLATAYFVQSRAPRPAPGSSMTLPAERADLRNSIKSELQAYLDAHPVDREFEQANQALARRENQTPTAWPKPAAPAFGDQVAGLR